MALEDEREEVKAIKKKNSNNIRDLQRQLQQSKRYRQSCDAMYDCTQSCGMDILSHIESHKQISL